MDKPNTFTCVLFLRIFVFTVILNPRRSNLQRIGGGGSYFPSPSILAPITDRDIQFFLGVLLHFYRKLLFPLTYGGQTAP